MSRPKDPAKDACLASLGRITEQLIGLMASTGVTVQEYCRLVRVRAVHSIASRLLSEEGRVSKSRVAILTGLPRGEVARILRLRDQASVEGFNANPARKVLSEWYENPQFVSPDGDPAILPVFGKRKSFERLVSRAAAGIPVRAMLDELVQLNAVDLMPGQLVKAKSRIPIHSKLTNQAVSALGERASDLLGTLRGNMVASDQLFEGTAVVTGITADALPLLRREMEEQGGSFVSSAISLLSRPNQSRSPRRHTLQKRFRFGVTTYCFQEELTQDKGASLPRIARRKNLRRENSRRGPANQNRSGR